MIHFISTYASDITKTQKEREDFYTKFLQKMIDEIPTKDETIILGDFNAKVGNEILVGVKKSIQ